MINGLGCVRASRHFGGHCEKTIHSPLRLFLWQLQRASCIRLACGPREWNIERMGISERRRRVASCDRIWGSAQSQNLTILHVTETSKRV